MSTTTKAYTEGQCHCFRFINSDTVPSWKRHSKGHAELSVSTHEMNHYLEFRLSEYSSNTRVRREAFVTLDAESAAHLFAWLKQRFERFDGLLESESERRVRSIS